MSTPRSQAYSGLPGIIFSVANSVTLVFRGKPGSMESWYFLQDSNVKMTSIQKNMGKTMGKEVVTDHIHKL